MAAKEFESILRNERVNKLVPLLKKLDKESRKEVGTSLKVLYKELVDYKENKNLLGQITYARKGSNEQVHMLNAAAFVCLNRKEFEKLDQFNQLLSNPFLDSILAWHCPDWFSEFVNRVAKLEWIPWNVTYELIMKLADSGYITVSDELIARLLPGAIFIGTVNHKHVYAPENLVKRGITLDKHIWIIFQYETDINHRDKYYDFQNSKKGVPHWLAALKHYTAEGKIDRLRILRESLLATTRNFNKALTGWFVDLLEYFEPTDEELLVLQPELLVALGSPHSRAVNTALSVIKKHIEKNTFNSDHFLERVSVLLASDTKSVVLTTIQILEKLLKKHPTRSNEICAIACQAFIHQDATIQEKAVKLLLKHTGGTNGLSGELEKYTTSLLASSGKALAHLIKDKEIHATEDAVVSGEVSEEPWIPVHLPNTIDELAFLASQAFDNNNPLHLDLLPASLVSLQDRIRVDDLHKLAPALQRAYALVLGDWPSTMGYLDHLLATFFIDTTKLLAKRFPGDDQVLQAVHDAAWKKENDNKAKRPRYSGRILEIATWTVGTYDNTYIIPKAIMLVAYDKINRRDCTPLLSTPTHEPAYIDPVVMVERLSSLNSLNLEPDVYDFQLAISRLAPFNHTEAEVKAKTLLTGEYQRLMEFLFVKEKSPDGPFTRSIVWFMAGLAKNRGTVYPQFDKMHYSTLSRSVLTGDFPWRSYAETRTNEQFNPKTKKREKVVTKNPVLRVTIPEAPTVWKIETKESKGMLSKLANVLKPQKEERTEPYLLFELLSMRAQWISAEHNDIERIIMMFPTNPNPILALVASRSLVYSKFWQETDKKLVINTLEALLKLTFVYSEMTSVFLSSCMLTSDKTVRSFAAALWSKGIRQNGFVEEFGKITGTHLAEGYAPIKRLVETITTDLFRISPENNVALEKTLGVIIEQLPDEPPVGTTQLLELYAEVLATNRSSITSNGVKGKLSQFGKKSGLKKVVSALA